MSETTDTASTALEGRPVGPAVRQVHAGIVLDILATGLRDFRTAPLHGLGVGGIYAVGGWVLVLLLVLFDLPFLVYPLAAGFALVAPFIATAFYAISRSMERGEPPSWRVIFRAARNATRSDLGWMALVTGFSLFIWMDIAAVLFFSFMGLQALGWNELLREVFGTPMGLLFLAIGNGVGAFLALAVFSFSVTSFPMLFDRDVDFVTAMVTSVKVVIANPLPMVLWAMTIAGLMFLSLLSGLFGLLVVLPVLGHASWHLYRRVIEWAADDAPPAHPGA